MAPDLPDKLLGIDIDGDDRAQRRSDDEDDEEELVRLVLFAVGEHRLAVPVDDVRTTTDLPDELTPVPRTPPAVEGVTDLRGEITAVIDPSVHFPTDEGGDGDGTAAGREQLLVFDRGADDQSAAIRVDDVLQVESVPERDLLDADDVAAREFETDVLEHPLVDALVERERRPTRRIGETVVSPAADDDDGDGPDATVEEAASTESPQDQDRPVVVELTPVVDVDDLLLAAGPRS